MNITNKIKVDLQNPGSTPIIHAVQTDSNVRNLEIELFNNHKAFPIPKDAQVIIRYRKFDGSGGEYDTLPDDTLAWHIRKNTLHLALVPQVLASPGSVSITVTLLSAGQQISIFPIRLNVDGIASAAIAKAENYFYVTGFLPAPKKAEVGQYLCVSDVTDTGKVVAVEAINVNPEAGETVDENTVHAIVDAYLAENPPVTKESDPTVPDWAKQPEKPTYTAQEIGAQPVGEYILKTELPDIISDTLAQAQEIGEFDGAPGAKGDKGDKGDTGAQGPQGEQGPAGDSGADGKSAYEYAQDGGYTGTEEKFAAKLAEEAPKLFEVTITDNGDSTYSSDHYFSDIKAAYNSGRMPIAVMGLNRYHLVYLANWAMQGVMFGRIAGTVLTTITIKASSVSVSTTTMATPEDIPDISAISLDPFFLYISAEANENGTYPIVGWSCGETIAEATDLEACLDAYLHGKQVFIQAAGSDGNTVDPLEGVVLPCTYCDGVFAIFSMEVTQGGYNMRFNAVVEDGVTTIEWYDSPTALPNPNALTFTGAATESYDGSSAKTVNIPTVPSALKNPNALTVNGTTYDGSAAVDMTETINAMVAAKLQPETELVLSDNLFDKSTAVLGKGFYHSSSGTTLIDKDDRYYAYVELRGAGTYRTKVDESFHSKSYAERVPLMDTSKAWIQNITGTITDTGDDSAWDLEFTVTQAMIDSGAVYYPLTIYESNINTVMMVKDREYPSEYIPYGYIEVEAEGSSEAGATNILSGKTAVFLGDSICAGTTVGDDSEYYGYGWAGLIGEGNAMTWKNYGRNGGTITPLSSVDTARWVPTQADSAFAAYPNADYVIFEGGCNDADTMKDALLGEISSDYATFDETTFSGAFENLVLKLLTNFPTAKIGYVIPQKMYAVNDHSAAGHVHRRFFDRAIAICEKWCIPYVDLWKGNPLNPKLSTAGTFYTDGQHLTLAGYQRITPQIEAFMRRL